MPESQALQVALSGLEGVAKRFDTPDADFAAIAIVEAKTGDLAIVPVYEYLQNDTTKELFFEAILPELVRELEVQRVVMVLSAWGLQVQGEDYFTSDEPRPSEHPDRFEIVTVVEMTGAGIESDRYAYINRDPFGKEIPTLGEFHHYPKDANRTGRAIEPVLEALKEVRDDG